MQITIIHKLQYALDISLKMLKFVWRHVCTFIVLGMLVAAFVMYPAIDWDKFFIELMVAIGLDKTKMNWKLSAYPGHQFSATSSLHHNSLANHSIDGSVFNSPHSSSLSIHHTSMKHTPCNNLHRENDNWYYHSLVNPSSTLSRHFE